MDRNGIRHLLTRVAISFLFLTFGAWEMANPSYWEGYLPAWLSLMHGIGALMVLHGLLLAAIGAAILLGIRPRISSAVGVLMLCVIIVLLYTGTGFTDILLRDITIAVFTLSMVFDDTRYLALFG